MGSWAIDLEQAIKSRVVETQAEITSWTQISIKAVDPVRGIAIVNTYPELKVDEVETETDGSTNTDPRDIMKLPLEERRKLLAKAAEKAKDDYAEGGELRLEE